MTDRERLDELYLGWVRGHGPFPQVGRDDALRLVEAAADLLRKARQEHYDAVADRNRAMVPSYAPGTGPADWHEANRRMTETSIAEGEASKRLTFAHRLLEGSGR